MGRRTSRRSSAATSSACSRPTSRRGADGLPPSSDTWSPGRSGATLAAFGVFLPLLPLRDRAGAVLPPLRRKRLVKAFVDGVTAAATGTIAGAAVVLGRRAIMDVPTIFIALVTLALLLVPKKIPEPVLILAAGFIGLVLKGTW